MRYLLAIALVFSFVGVVNAAGIPTAADPQHAPEIWTQEVYNNGTTAITSGTCVRWDMQSDTADVNFAYRTSWIIKSDAADLINVAGIVVDDSIPAKGQGTICIYGPVYALVADSTAAVTAANGIASSSVAGQVDDGAALDLDKARIGWSIIATPVATSLGGYGGTDGNDFVMQPIFVRPN